MIFKRFAIAIGAAALLATGHLRAVTFNLIPDAGTPQFAIDGFNTAAGLWSSSLADNITVNIEIGFTPLGPNIIGQTGSGFVETTYSQVAQALAANRTSADDYSSYAALQPGASYNRLINYTSDNPNGPNSGSPYVDTMDRVGLTTANAKALGLLAPNSSLDAIIRFSSDFSFDFNHNNVAPGKIDFVGAAAHEIGHALGFISGVDDIDTLNGASPGDAFSSNLLDLFRYSPLSLAQGAGVTDYTADPRDKFFSVDGGVTPVALFADGIDHGDGQQASHWKDNLGIGIMDPTASYGETLNISPTDLRAFDVLGYTVVPEPAAGELSGVSLLVLVVFRSWFRGHSSVLLKNRQSAK
jgi:hypothetical protein